MTIDVDLSELFEEAFYFYFKRNLGRGELTTSQTIEKHSYFLSTIQHYLVEKQKQKTKTTMNGLYKQWITDQAFLRNKIIDMIRNVYVPRIDSLSTFFLYHYSFEGNIKRFLYVFSPFEQTLRYYASILDKSIITIEKLANYEWEFSFTDEQLKQLAKKEANQFPIISSHIPRFLKTIQTRHVFCDTYVKELNKQVREMIREKWIYIQKNTTDKDEIIIKKIDFVRDMYKLFTEDLHLYKQYFKDAYEDLFKSFQKDIVLKKYNSHYDLELTLLDDFFTIEWWKPKHKVIQQKWISLATEHYSEISWEFVSIQYYGFLKNHYYYFTQNLEEEITHNEYFLFLEEIFVNMFPFNTKYISKSIIMIFHSCAYKFIKEYWKEDVKTLFFKYLKHVRKQKIILNTHKIILGYLLEIYNNDNNMNGLLQNYNTLLQKRILKLFLNTSQNGDTYPLQHYIEFERIMIDKIDDLSGSTTWFNDKSKWTKMLNELQESEQFTNTITLIDHSLRPCEVFIGTYGFYPDIEKTYGIHEDHYLFREWSQIESFYPVLHEKKKLQLLYNNSTAEVEIGNVTLLCSMDVVDIIMKWQKLWDENKSIHVQHKIEKKIVHELITHRILENRNDEIIICNDGLTDKKLIKLLFYKKNYIVKEQKLAHIHVFDELQYYLVAIVRECKKEKEINIDDLWVAVQKKLKDKMSLEPSQDLFNKSIEKAIENEYIEQNDKTIVYV